MRFCDHLIAGLETLGVTHCFMVAGGAAMHLNDAFRVSKKISVVCLHNEQSCAMAAEAYYKLSGRVAAICVTAGPGALNTLNGVWGAFADSAAMIVVAGQCRTDHISEELDAAARPRLFGDQDCPTRAVVSPMVKKFHRVMQPTQAELVKSINIMSESFSGRPGPVWIELPINVQGAALTVGAPINPTVCTQLRDDVGHVAPLAQDFVERVSNAERPVIIVGNGVRFSKTEADILEIASFCKIPILPVWNSIDLVPSDHPCCAGRPGADGDRAGNFVQQHSDCVIILGARMHVRQTGFDFPAFARSAKQVLMVDVDELEFKKPNLKISNSYHANLSDFIPLVKKNIEEKYEIFRDKFSYFLDWAKNVHIKNNILIEIEANIKAENAVNPYVFIDQLFRLTDSSTPVVTSDGTAAVITQKVAVISGDRRVITNKGCASMGFELPAAIGMFEASRSSVICIAGDGSIMMNLQELAIIGGRQLPIAIFILNNEGYHSIRQTQHNYFEGKEIGCGYDSGLYFPRFENVASAFDLNYMCIRDLNSDFSRVLSKVSDLTTPSIFEVFVDKNVKFTPRMKTIKRADQSLVSLPLEDMDPLIEKEKLEEFAPGYIRPTFDEQ